MAISLDLYTDIASVDIAGVLTSASIDLVGADLMAALADTASAFVANMVRVAVALSTPDWGGLEASRAVLGIPGAIVVAPQALRSAQHYAELMRSRGYSRRAFTCARRADSWAAEQADLQQAQAQWRLSQACSGFPRTARFASPGL